MIVPNKVTPLDKSIIGKMSELFVDGVEEIKILDLFEMKGRKFSDVGEFILALDALYALGRIEIEETKGIVRYVG